MLSSLAVASMISSETGIWDLLHSLRHFFTLASFLTTLNIVVPFTFMSHAILAVVKKSSFLAHAFKYLKLIFTMGAFVLDINNGQWSNNPGLRREPWHLWAFWRNWAFTSTLSSLQSMRLAPVEEFDHENLGPCSCISSRPAVSTIIKGQHGS